MQQSMIMLHSSYYTQSKVNKEMILEDRKEGKASKKELAHTKCEGMDQSDLRTSWPGLRVIFSSLCAHSSKVMLDIMVR